MTMQSEETSRLLPPVGLPEERANKSSSLHSSTVHSSNRALSLLKQLSCLRCNICIKSKPVILILVWSVVIGALCFALLSGFGTLAFFLRNHEHQRNHPLWYPVIPVFVMLASYAVLALTLLLYPVSGYIADIHYGRYKAVTLSFLLIWISMLFLSAAGVGGMITHFPDQPGPSIAIPIGLCAVLSILLIIVSLACFQSNIIQMGMDQLLEASSDKLALFLHWLMWSYNLGNSLTLLSVVFAPCYVQVEPIKMKFMYTLASGPFLCLVLVTLLLAFTCYNHSWFYSEPGQNNPYKMVYKVLSFARKHKCPIHRSAFTFSDDFKPSRIDFAKERYGGPFTSPQVEDVKTFLRIVIVLLALGPVFVLEVPGSYYLFPLFALHVGGEIQFEHNKTCHSLAKWVLLQSRSLGYIAPVFILPIYIWVIFSLFRKRIPKIFNRLWCAVFVSLSGVASMLIIDLIGHFHHQRSHFNVKNSTENTCLFTSNFLYPKHGENLPVVLALPWGVTVAPVIMLSIGSLLVHATAFEFISAQSPHSMKGLLVGVFFAIKGLFQFIGAAAVVPFAVPNLWNNINSVTNCDFGYYLFTIVVGLVGLAVFSIVVRSYKYRQRDERPFDTRFAEQYYERYIGTSHNHASGVYSPSEENRRPAIEELHYTASSDSAS